MNVKFLGSFKDKFPFPHFKEVVFVGRSNVGKSSLINMITGKNIAKVSKSPGKTRLINYFLIDDKVFLVDVPGYGYAKVSKTMQREWKSLMENYFKERRKNIKMVFLLIDSRVGFTPLDEMMAEWLEALNIPFTIVFTKIDKLDQSELARLKREIKSMDYKCVLTSAKEGTGKKELTSLIF